MDRTGRQIFRERLEEATLQDLERMVKDEVIRKEKWFKDLSALYVILCACDDSCATDPDRYNEFADFYTRLVTVFTEATRENAEKDPEIKRPTFLRVASDANSNVQWKFIKFITEDLNGDYSHGFCDAIMHLMLSDANSSFSQLVSRNRHTRVEVPCFYEMFHCSSSNNQRNEALFGEYVALVGICFFKEYFADRSSYKTETMKFDFAIRETTNGVEKIVNFSVKSANLQGAQLFSPSESRDQWSPSNELDSVSEREGVNILLHNCSCTGCQASAVREVKVKMEFSNPQQRVRTKTVTGLDEGCECKNQFEDILKKYESNSVVYLVSAQLFFELRHALTMFDQKTFRGTKKSFKLRDHIQDLLEKRGDQADNHPEQWLKTLIDKS